MGPVDFVRQMEEALIGVCGHFGVPAGRVAGLTGVWCGVPANGESTHSNARKIAAIGIHVSRGITSHGFAFNVTTALEDFALIIPCGIADHGVTSLEKELGAANPAELPTLEAVAREAARQFGDVLGEPVLAVESIAELRAQADITETPAEDTPLQVPAEVERLRGGPERPVRA